jgi:uncharacterized protein (TIGR02145 family)/uncharacterized repeat protein (TIGR02543 family)
MKKLEFLVIVPLALSGRFNFSMITSISVDIKTNYLFQSIINTKPEKMISFFLIIVYFVASNLFSQDFEISIASTPGLIMVPAMNTQPEDLDLSVLKPDVFRAKNYLLTNINVSRSPQQVIIPPGMQKAFVLCKGTSEILVIDLVSASVVKSIALNCFPVDMIINRNGSKIYVASISSQLPASFPPDDCGTIGVAIGPSPLIVINTITQSIEHTFTNNVSFRKVILDETSSKLYTIGSQSYINVYDLNSYQFLTSYNLSVLSGHTSQPNSSALAVNANKLFVKSVIFVGSNVLGQIQVIDMNNNMFNTITFDTLGYSSSAFFHNNVMISPDGQEIYIDAGTSSIPPNAQATFFLNPETETISDIVFNLSTRNGLIPYSDSIAIFDEYWFFGEKTLFDFKNHQILDFFNYGGCSGAVSPDKKTLYLTQIGANHDAGVTYGSPVKYDITLLDLVTGSGEVIYVSNQVFNCSYERMLDITSNGQFVVTTNSALNTVSVLEIPVESPPEVYAGEDANIFENETYVISGATATNHNTLLWSTSGDGYFADTTLVSTEYTPGFNDISNGAVELCLTGYNDYGEATDCMILTISQAITDIISLNAGWNLISFDVIPDPSTPGSVFESLITNGNLQMVTGFQNQQGVFFNPSGPPFLNTLLTLISGEGYWIKVNSETTLYVTGDTIPPTFTINLKTGWNLIGYWPQETTTPEAAFASLITAGILEMVTGYELGGKFFDPAGPPFLNTLTEIKHGLGYWVKLSANYNNFSYPVGTWSCGDLIYDERDGQSYTTVQIGEQCWMAENLNIGSMINGSQNQSDNGVIEKYCYNNDVAQCDIYGGLYQWNEMMQYTTTADVQGICPDGWHLPTDAEWTALTTFVSSQPTNLCNSNTSYIAKALAAKANWSISSNTCAVGNDLSTNNATGLTGLPGGYRGTNGNFGLIGFGGNFWSSTENSTTNAWYRSLYFSFTYVNRNVDTKGSGFSVRCLRDETSPPTTHNLNLEVNPSGAGTVTGDGQYEAGDLVNITAEASPGWEFVNWTEDDGIVSEIPEFTYTMPAQDVTLTANFVEEQVGFTCGDTLVDSRDDQSYTTVQIGEQCWMAENLNIGSMINGTQNQSDNGVIEKYCYNNDAAQCDIYGGLYQWDEMMIYTTTPSTQGICPDGWHLPTDGQWIELTTFIKNQPEYLCNSNTNYIAKALASTAYWNLDNNTCTVGNNPSANNTSNFNGLPGGDRWSTGVFGYTSDGGYWWSSTNSSATSAWIRILFYDYSRVYRININKELGFSVRCLRNETTPPTTYNLNLGVNPTGAGTVTGQGQYEAGEQVNITAEANQGWEFVNWTDDDGLVSEAANFVYTMLAEDITLTANFVEEQVGFTCGDPLIDNRDGQSYETVQIGEQCWMAENLNIGIRINGSSNQTNNGTIEKYCLNNLDANCNNYGGLYQWDEMMQYSTTAGVQGICPSGWHVPTDGEWTALTNYVSNQPEYICNNNASYISKALAATTNWIISVQTCAVGNNLSANNASKFTALPGCYRYGSGSYSETGSSGFWWSSSEESATDAWYRFMGYVYAVIYQTPGDKDWGFSVRCLRD